MSSVQLSYNLLPADRCANTNFRHTFFCLAVVETILTGMSTALCSVLSICIYTRQPFIFLHTSFHPFIQASIFMTAAVSQLIKLVSLVYCTVKIIVNDGEIFIASAKVDVRPALERERGEKNPNERARRCFKNRQEHVKRLRKIVRFYPLIQLLCGSLSLAFWCTSDERHQLSQPYYQQLKRTQGPSNVTFLIYLVTWSIDLLVTPLFLLITTWHYSRVDWQIQLLAAQETMEQSFSRTNPQSQERRRSRPRRNSRTINGEKEHSMGPHAEKFKSVSPTFAPNNSMQRKQQQEGVTEQAQTREQEQAQMKEHEQSTDVHTTNAPTSMPVSPSTSSSSCASSLSPNGAPSFNSETSKCEGETSNDQVQSSDGDGQDDNGAERQLMRMTAPIRRPVSGDLSTLLLNSIRGLAGVSPLRDVKRDQGDSGEGSRDESPRPDESIRSVEESDSFRICIQTDDSTGSASTHMPADN